MSWIRTVERTTPVPQNGDPDLLDTLYTKGPSDPTSSGTTLCGLAIRCQQTA
jgi:hypothetical protein